MLLILLLAQVLMSAGLRKCHEYPRLHVREFVSRAVDPEAFPSSDDEEDSSD